MKLFFLILAISSSAFAGTEKQFTVEGEVAKFTQENVTLVVKGGKQVTVPREAIPTYYSVKTGYRVIAYVPSGQVVQKKKKR